MIRTKLLSRYSTLAVRALVTASVAERCFTSGRCFHNHCATDIPTASVHHHQNVKDVHASCCGFPKHLKNGPSTVLDQGVFGDDACFIAHFENTYVVGMWFSICTFHFPLIKEQIARSAHSITDSYES